MCGVIRLFGLMLSVFTFAWPPSTTHIGDCTFIVLEIMEGTLWYVMKEGLF